MFLKGYSLLLRSDLSTSTSLCLQHEPYSSILISQERTTMTSDIAIHEYRSVLVNPTVFTRISAAALISFFALQVRRLFKGGAYSRAALI